MEFSILFSILLAHFVLYCQSDIIIPPEHRFYAQRLDHFDRNNTRTWQQRFFLKTINALNASAPCILGLIDGVAEAHHAEEGFLVEQAKKLQANLFVTDVRYFGFSRPTEDLSDENLKYLTIEQMAADISYFIRGMNLFLEVRDPYHVRSRRWIVEGTGIPGLLAALARVKDPDFILGAVECGATIIPTMEHWELFPNAFSYIRSVSPDCMDNIINGYGQLHAITKTTSSAQELGDAFVLCSGTEDQAILRDIDISSLTYTIARLLVSQIAHNRNYNVHALRDVCTMMNNKTIGSAYKRLTKVVDKLRIAKHQQCIPLYDDYVKKLKDVSYSAQLHEMFPQLRQWKYLQCTQLALFPSSRKVQDVFHGDQLKVHILEGICKDTFSFWKRENLEEYVNRSTTWIQAKFQDLTNVIFIHEKSNPARSRFYRTTNEKSVNILIEGSGGCAIFDKSHSDDTAEITDARNEIIDVMAGWISNAKKE